MHLYTISSQSLRSYLLRIKGRLPKLHKKEDQTARYTYLDLLATALTEHEKNLNNLIERLDKVTRQLSKAAKQEPIDESLNALLKTAKELLLERYNK